MYIPVSVEKGLFSNIKFDNLPEVDWDNLVWARITTPPLPIIATNSSSYARSGQQLIGVVLPENIFGQNGNFAIYNSNFRNPDAIAAYLAEDKSGASETVAKRLTYALSAADKNSIWGVSILAPLEVFATSFSPPDASDTYTLTMLPKIGHLYVVNPFAKMAIYSQPYPHYGVISYEDLQR